MQIPQAEVMEGLSTTTFEIANQATIPSDNASHKVTNYLIVGLNHLYHGYTGVSWYSGVESAL